MKRRGGARGRKNRSHREVNDQIQHVIRALHTDHLPALPADGADPTNPARLDLQTRIALQVTAKVREGRVSKAAKLAYRIQTVQAMDEKQTHQRLIQLHPQSSKSMPPPPASSRGAVIAADDDFVKAVNNIANGSSPGPSGLTGEMLLPLLSDEDCIRGLAKLVTDVNSGDLPSDFKPYLLPSDLIAIPKPGNVRPIAMCETLWKLTTSIAATEAGPAARAICEPHQFAIARPSGCETVVQTLQARLLQPNTVVASIDFANAFNSAERSDLLSELFRHDALAPLHKLAAWGYSDGTPLWRYDDQRKIRSMLLSTNGVRQGCPLAALIFAVGIAPVYKKAIEGTGADCMAFLDDGNFVGTPEQVLAAIKRLEPLANRLGLKFVDQKSQWFSLNDDPHLPTVQEWLDGRQGVKVVRDAGLILGAPVGLNRAAIEKLLDDCIREHDTFFNLLLHDSIPPQEALILLRLSGVPRMNYLTRCVDPDLTRKATKAFDDRVLTTALTKLCIPTQPSNDTAARYNRANTLLTLPVRYGGFGLRSTYRTRHAAFWGGLAHAASTLARYAPLPPRSLSTIEKTLKTLQQQTEMAGAPFESLPTQAANALHRLANPQRDDPTNIQRDLTQRIEDKLYRQFSDAATTPAEKARLLSISGPWASAWVSCIPTDPSLLLRPEQYQLAARLRLGLPLTSNMPDRCVCGEQFRDDETHALSCIYFKPLVTERHHKVAQIAVKYLHRIHTRAVWQPTYLSRVLFPDVDYDLKEERWLGDVTIPHPIARSNVQVACRAQGQLVADAEAEKISKYRQLSAQYAAGFTPLVVDTFGCFGSKARQFVLDVARAVDDETCDWRQWEILYGLSNSIAIAVQRGNAAVIREGFTQARANPDRQVQFRVRLR